MEWNFNADGPVEADVGLPAGMIEVTGAADGALTVRLEALSTGRRAQELVASAEVAFTDGRLRVVVPDRRGRTAEIGCSLALPEGSALTTRTASADVHCPVRLGRFSATTASGDMAIGNVEGDVSVKAASGDLQCSEIGGRLDVRTASGDVSVRTTRGEVHVSTASGDLEIADACSSVKVETASGDVAIRRASAGRVQVSSASGDVTVGVASGVGAYLDLSTVSGDTSTTLPFTEEAASESALEIVCRTVSGDVAIRKAAS